MSGVRKAEISLRLRARSASLEQAADVGVDRAVAALGIWNRAAEVLGIGSDGDVDTSAMLSMPMSEGIHYSVT
ncbi:hypothetical protein [Burkholderia guangdongensis]|uniref:hypothetical protein n=1 Tax=Burkholderia guangdongensis TaxID=1792500 RepID=UPI0015CE1279|nr:hypothetical protein [Burkholderia guangdongensis]